MQLTSTADQVINFARSGVQPLTARWEPWMDDLTADPERCADLVARLGSPVHVHDASPFARNVIELQDAADHRQIKFGVYFARKANKCLTYVDAARRAGIGVDVASVQELEQALERDIPSDFLIVTSAVKPRPLLELSVDHGVCIAIDNEDEAVALTAICDERSKTARVAVRVHGFPTGERTLDSRFGLPIDDVPSAIDRWSKKGDVLQVEGIHFHLDGYSAADRVTALDASLDLTENLRAAGVQIQFIDMGGGFPISYVDDEVEWDSYWRSLEASLLAKAPPITYGNHGFGLFEHGGKVVGTRNAYPHAQSPVGGAWLGEILDSPRPSKPDTTIARALQQSDIRLHCEPGRALLDGCGVTLARVEHRKKVGDDWLIGLHMNSSNCRSRKSELFADPRLVAVGERPNQPMTGYLTGAYCTESDLIMHRRLHFPDGVTIGDVIAFPNTAGYLMHFVESRSHQFDLPKNVVLTADGAAMDPIDV